jgi:uncharacterized membrane protein YkvA (DUF1232 family)
MPDWAWIALATAAALYAAFVLALVVAGRKTDARAWAGFIPDCFVLCKRLLGDPRVPLTRKLLLGVLVAYLAMPFDLVPDFIPVAGQLDDAIVVALVVRSILRAAGEAPIRQHWPGPEASLRLIMRLTAPAGTAGTGR